MIDFMSNHHSANEETLRFQLQPLQPLLDDPDVTEVMVTGAGLVFVEKKGGMCDTGIVMAEAPRSMIATTIGKINQIDMLAGSGSAVVSASVGSNRYAAALMPVNPLGTTLCIRVHRENKERPSLEKLIEWGSLPQKFADALTKYVIKESRNCLIVGATGCGKTTLLNALVHQIPLHERLGIIEDAKEISVPHKNCDSYLTNAQSGLTARLLVQHAMRSRYDRLILGESRGDDTFDLIRALSAGHGGSLTTIHASSLDDALYTFELLYQMSLPPNSQISTEQSRQSIARAIGMVVYCERSYQTDENGVARTVRKVKDLGLVNGVNSNEQYNVERISA
jgi:pilus assembly protein CpaF